MQGIVAGCGTKKYPVKPPVFFVVDLLREKN
jgi:hypothetical protein